MLAPSDLIRYGRQILYPGFGSEKQKMLEESHVVVAGIGGLGCAASLYLSSAGIGHITLVDCDLVELSNLNRQILYWEEDLGKEKPLVAEQRLRKFNSSIKFTSVFERITSDNVRDIIKGANVVVDGLDNYETRLILNSACVDQKIPLIHGGIYGFTGEVTTVVPGKSPCLACFLDKKIPEPTGPVPVFGVVPALVASFQVTEVIKLLTGFGNLLTGKMLYFNTETMDLVCVDVSKNPNCKVCLDTGAFP